jgi:two-component system KDP operon response regulator KdpE
VVEDDPASLEATSALLAGDSRQVLSAACGKDALRLATESPPDLLVTDYRLPDMTGAELVDALARSTGRPVTAVALTGYSRTELGTDAAAFARVLRKPVAIAELEATLRLLG